MKVPLIIAIFLFVACHSEEKKKPQHEGSLVVEKNDSLKINSEKTPLSFIDSIQKKYELSISQIRAHTLIDSVFYTGMYTDVAFTGDSIINFHNGLKGAVITYNDKKNCRYKFLVILNSSTVKTDNKIVYTNCDRDGDSEYTTLDYKFLQDSTLETFENFYPENSDKKQIRNRIKWVVNRAVVIDSIH